MANIQLADNLRRLRKQYNYTQAQIGEKLHITHQAYSNYETGVREPNLQLLAELSWISHLCRLAYHSVLQCKESIIS